MPHTRDNFCECEHASHFDTERIDSSPEHPYGTVPADPDSCVKTPFGSFSLCRRCAEAGHMVID